MQREQATAVEDLPHAYRETSAGACEVCGCPALQARHLEWEKSAEAPLGLQEDLPRELGS